jgi:hypothetical protein
MNDIATALTDSLSRTGSGNVSVPIEFVNGTKAAPGASFINESASGLYRASANDIRFSVNNTDHMRWSTANGVQIYDGAGWRDIMKGTLGSTEGAVLAWDNTNSVWSPPANVTINRTTGDTAVNKITVGNSVLTDDDVFFLSAPTATSSRLQFDSKDHITYERATDTYSLIINGSSQLDITATTVDAKNNRVVTTGDVDASKVIAANDVLGVTDNFYMGQMSSVLPVLWYDVGDYIQYHRTNNEWSFYIGFSSVLNLDATDMDALALNILTTGNMETDQITVGNPTLTTDDQFYIDAAAADEPRINFDTQDNLVFDRTDNEFRFIIGGVHPTSTKMAINATGIDIYSGTFATSGNCSLDGTTTFQNDVLIAQDQFFMGAADNFTPTVNFDASGDRLEYDRLNNEYRFDIGGTEELSIAAGTIDAQNNDIETTGTLKFGTHSAIGAETVTGFITITDGGGTTRKLAVVS